MKNFKTLCVAACVAMVGLSSCLGDGKTVTKGTDVPTVVRTVTFEDFSTKKLMVTPYGYLSTADAYLVDYEDGDCVLIDFTYDSSDPNNDGSAARGYSYVTLDQVVEPVNDWPCNSITSNDTTLTDPSVEQPLTYAISSLQKAAYVDGYIFLPSAFKGKETRQTVWRMAANRYAEPEWVKGKRTFHMWMRAQITYDGDPNTKETDMVKTNAYYIKDVIDGWNTYMQNNCETEDSYYVLIHYIRSINQNGEPEWAETEQLQFMVPLKEDEY